MRPDNFGVCDHWSWLYVFLSAGNDPRVVHRPSLQHFRRNSEACGIRWDFCGVAR